MNKERIQSVCQSEFFKSMRKEWMFKAFVQCFFPRLLLCMAMGLFFWPLFIPFGLLTVAVALKETVNLRCSLLSLAELSPNDFDELVRLNGEGRLESAVVGSFAEGGLLFRSSYIPYNGIVKMKYYTPRVLPQFIIELVMDLLFGSPWRSKLPCVIIYRKVRLFGKEFTMRSEHRLSGNVNHSSALDKFTDTVLARSKNTILVDNDYFFDNI